MKRYHVVMLTLSLSLLLASCAYYPYDRYWDIGFRVVASHVILSLERVSGLPEMPGGWARSARFPAEVVNDGAVRVLAARATSL